MRGIALVEVMVSLVVLAIGILGLAALQFASLKFNRGSYERSQATLLVYEIADKMRANRTEAYKGSYAVARGSQPSTTPSKNCGDGTTACTSSEMANYDVATWYSRMSAALPGSKAEISCDPSCSATAQQRVTVFWPESKTFDGKTADGKTDVDLRSCKDPTPLTDNSCVTTVLFP